jgi:phage head maturation protease
MSFSFRAKQEAWPARDRRELQSVELIEVSVVHSHPAYAGTSIATRSRLLAGPAATAALRRRRLVVI